MKEEHRRSYVRERLIGWNGILQAENKIIQLVQFKKQMLRECDYSL